MYTHTRTDQKVSGLHIVMLAYSTNSCDRLQNALFDFLHRILPTFVERLERPIGTCIPVELLQRLGRSRLVIIALKTATIRETLHLRKHEITGYEV